MLQHRFASVGFRLAAVLGLMGLLPGCGGDYVSQDASGAKKPEELLTDILASLKDTTPTVALYNNAVQQLNHYLNLKKEEQDKLKMADADRKLIEEQLLQMMTRADRDELLKELERPSYSQLDANHIDACFLFRDAARSLKAGLGVEPEKGDSKANDYKLRLAQRAFDWVVRQVWLRPEEKGKEPWPAHEVLRQGTGTAEERGRVFLALMEQMQLDGCMIECEEESKNAQGVTEKRKRSWIPGVLIGKLVYLFDTNVGLPIRGPGGQGVATLQQAMSEASILDKSASPIKAAQLEKAALLISSSLPALSPRIRYLQSVLSDDNRVVLYENLSGSLQRFQEANLGVPVRLWTNARAYPAIVLPRYVANPLKQPRLIDTIVPRYIIPRWALVFAARSQATREDKMFKRFDNLFLRLRIEPGEARDSLVRGLPEQAIARLLTLETRLDHVLESGRRLPDPSQDMAKTWVKEIDKAEKDLESIMAKRDAGGVATPQEVNIRRAIDGSWKNQEVNLFHLSYEWAAPEYRQLLTYFMGLAKMEQAARADFLAANQNTSASGKDSLTSEQRWDSAAEWLERYQAMTMQGSRSYSPWTNAVGFHLARCRAAQKRFAEAVKQLEQITISDVELQSREGKFQALARDQMLAEFRGKLAVAGKK